MDKILMDGDVTDLIHTHVLRYEFALEYVHGRRVKIDDGATPNFSCYFLATRRV